MINEYKLKEYALVIVFMLILLVVITTLFINKNNSSSNKEEDVSSWKLPPLWAVKCWWNQTQIENYYKVSKATQKRLIEKCQENILTDEEKMMKEMKEKMEQNKIIEKKKQIKDLKNILSE